MVSVVIPVYNEGEQIFNSIQTIHNALTTANIEHCFTLVDDGSRDNTWDELCRLAQTLPNVTAHSLSRNFGKEAALCAGLENADGDAFLVMDADLQHPPELIPQMVEKWQEGYDVVEGVKTNRGKESFASKIAAATFYRAFTKASGIDLGRASDFKLLDRRVVDAWRGMPETHTFFRGMSAWVGYKRYAIPFKVADRAGGETKWTLRSLSKLALHALTSYTAAPLYFVFWMGILLFIFSILLAIETLYVTVIHPQFGKGFPTVILLQLIIGSCLMVSLGIIGLYISRIYDEVKRRPRFIVGKTAKSPQAEDSTTAD